MDNTGICNHMIPDAEKLRKLRLARGWSQEQLAAIASTTTRTVQRLESGRSALLETLKAVASVLEVDFHDLLVVPEIDPLAAERKQIEAEFARRERERALRQEITSRLVEYWNSKTPGFELNHEGHRSLEKWRRDFSDDEIMEAMDIAELQYLEFDYRGQCTKESAEHAFGKVPGICFVSRERPEERDIYYIRGMLRKRVPGYFDETRALQWLRNAHRAGVAISDLKMLAASIYNWTQFRVGVDELINASLYRIGNAPCEIGEPSKLLSTSAPDEPESVAEHAVLPALSTESRDIFDYVQAAVAVLKQARQTGESWITINFEEKTYYFGRSPDGYGTPYPVDHYLALDELAGAIERRFRFLSFRR
jgi:transcriptional regulator with XRE-family HTH domain